MNQLPLFLCEQQGKEGAAAEEAEGEHPLYHRPTLPLTWAPGELPGAPAGLGQAGVLQRPPRDSNCGAQILDTCHVNHSLCRYVRQSVQHDLQKCFVPI